MQHAKLQARHHLQTAEGGQQARVGMAQAVRDVHQGGEATMDGGLKHYFCTARDSRKVQKYAGRAIHSIVAHQQADMQSKSEVKVDKAGSVRGRRQWDSGTDSALKRVRALCRQAESQVSNYSDRKSVV